MADTTIQYVTKKGERWDSISQKMYGTPFEVKRITDANVNVPYLARLDAGIVLDIPVVEEASVTVDTSLLPPWKR